MKILAIADPHGNYSKISPIIEKAGKVDLVLIAGDITNFGPDEKASELTGMFQVPVMAVPGNCDMESILNTLERSDAINLHNKHKCIDNITFIGLGGSNPTPFNTPFELDEEEIEQKLLDLLASARSDSASKCRILLSHAPPHETLDIVGTNNVGSRSIRDVLDQFDLVVCAHIHESRGVMKHNETFILNPGMACEGYAALINIDDKTKDIQIELIEA